MERSAASAPRSRAANSRCVARRSVRAAAAPRGAAARQRRMGRSHRRHHGVGAAAVPGRRLNHDVHASPCMHMRLHATPCREMCGYASLLPPPRIALFFFRKSCAWHIHSVYMACAWRIHVCSSTCFWGKNSALLGEIQPIPLIVQGLGMRWGGVQNERVNSGQPAILKGSPRGSS